MQFEIFWINPLAYTHARYVTWPGIAARGCARATGRGGNWKFLFHRFLDQRSCDAAVEVKSLNQPNTVRSAGEEESRVPVGRQQRALFIPASASSVVISSLKMGSRKRKRQEKYLWTLFKWILFIVYVGVVSTNVRKFRNLLYLQSHIFACQIIGEDKEKKLKSSYLILLWVILYVQWKYAHCGVSCYNVKSTGINQTKIRAGVMLYKSEFWNINNIYKVPYDIFSWHYTSSFRA